MPLGFLDPRRARQRQLDSSPSYVGTGPRSPVQRSLPPGGYAIPESFGPRRRPTPGGSLQDLAGQINQNVPQSPLGSPPPGSGIPTSDELMALLAGGGGGGGAGRIGSSFDAQIAALRGGASRIGGLTNQLIGNINSSAGAANQQIGGFFDYAAGAANEGRPVIQDTYQTASTNVDSVYDNLAAQLGGLPQQAVDSAAAAGGTNVGESVAGRVAAAAAPFMAAGESSRASTQGNLAQHSAAGQDYLSQLAAAAPSEAAMAQSAVTGRANMAVTSAQMALAEQQARIEAQAAGIEGAKQRALVEHSADTASSTFERLMQATQLEGAMLQNEGRRASLLGGGDPMDRAQLDHQLLQNQALMQQLQGSDLSQGSGYPDFDRSLQGADPATQQMAQSLLPFVDQGQDVMGLIDSLTPSKGREEPAGWLGRLFGQDTRTVDSPTAQTLDELAQQILSEGGEGSLFSEADPEALRRAFRVLAQS